VALAILMSRCAAVALLFSPGLISITSDFGFPTSSLLAWPCNGNASECCWNTGRSSLSGQLHFPMHAAYFRRTEVQIDTSTVHDLQATVQAQLRHIISASGDLLETSEAEVAIAGMSSNNQVCLKAAVAVGRLRRHSQSLAARLQSADLLAARHLQAHSCEDSCTVSHADPRSCAIAGPGSSCSNVISGGERGGTVQDWCHDDGAIGGHAWEEKGSCSPRLWNMQSHGLHQRRDGHGAQYHGRGEWDSNLTFASEGPQGNDDVDDTVSDFLGSIASQAAL
jgi:hypothetical protein